ncbi:MAG TPA: hypothetical protein VE055_02255 [Gaiellaceae bacterium]|nr:hypothetical protein [Gaiellaceae bacterium]
MVDRSTRFFWAASYGQIYPELLYLYERRAGRGGLLVRLSLGFVAVQSTIGLLSNSTTVYLAQPVLVAGAWGLAFLVSVPLGRPLAGALAAAWYPFPAWLRASERFKRVFGGCGASPTSSRPLDVVRKDIYSGWRTYVRSLQPRGALDADRQTAGDLEVPDRLRRRARLPADGA